MSKLGSKVKVTGTIAKEYTPLCSPNELGTACADVCTTRGPRRGEGRVPRRGGSRPRWYDARQNSPTLASTRLLSLGGSSPRDGAQLGQARSLLAPALFLGESPCFSG